METLYDDIDDGDDGDDDGDYDESGNDDDFEVSHKIHDIHDTHDIHVESSKPVKSENVPPSQQTTSTTQSHTFVILPFLYNVELAMSKISMSGNTFNSPVQIGDFNKIEIDDFNSYVNSSLYHSKSYEIAPLLIEMHTLLVETPEIQDTDKTEAKKSLRTLTTEISKPENEQDGSKLKKHWQGFISLIKDVGSIVGVATTIGKMLGLPLP